MAGLRPVRRVVRRRSLGCDARPDHLRQGRQLRLRAARRRGHHRRDRRDVRRAGRTPAASPTPAIRSPAPARSRACGSSRRNGSSSTPARLGADVIGPELAKIADRHPSRRRGARAGRVLGARAGPRPGDPRAARAVQRRRTRTPSRWRSSPPRASSAGCGRSSHFNRTARRAAVHDDRGRGARGAGDPRRGAGGGRPATTPAPDPIRRRRGCRCARRERR